MGIGVQQGTGPAGASGPRTTRRTLVRGAAWTLPAVAAVSAAPAFAASTCSPVTIDFTNYTTGQSVPSGTAYTIGGVTITLTLSGATGATNNSTVYATTSSTKELRFYDQNASSTSQTIKLDFSQQVKNLTITFVDVDYAQNSFDDRLIINTAGYTAAVGSNIVGAGTTNSPYRSTQQSADGATTNNVAPTWTSATSVNVTYAQGSGTIAGNPHIGIRTIVFTPTSC